jgi:hypothetical protein
VLTRAQREVLVVQEQRDPVLLIHPN